MVKNINCKRANMPARYAFLNWPLLEPDDKGIVTWSIGNFTPDLDKSIVIEAFDAMIQRWQKVLDNIEPVGNYICFKKTSDFRSAQVKFLFMPPHEHTYTFKLQDGSDYTHHTDWPLDGPQGVLGQVPFGSHLMELDEGEQWAIARKFIEYKGDWTLFVDIGEVIEHEFGHILDLGHTKDKKDIMYPSYDTNVKKGITEDSIKGLSERYSQVKYKAKELSESMANEAAAPTSWEGIRYFKPEEFNSRDISSGGDKMSLEFIARLDAARSGAGIPFHILSGYRTKAHNKAVGGKVNSSHLIGRAADIRASNSHERMIILRSLMDVGFTRLGIDNMFIHVDDDPTKDSEVAWLYNRSAKFESDIKLSKYDGPITPEVVADVIEKLTIEKNSLPAQLGGIDWPEIIDGVITFLKGVQKRMFNSDGSMKKPGFFRRLLFGFLTNLVWAFVRKVVKQVKSL